MKNAKIIKIHENVFKDNSNIKKFLNKKKSNSSKINNITIIRIDNDVYAGEIKDGKPHGQGIWKYYHEGKAEGRYVGEFKEGNRHGEGTWIIDGCSYEGEWKLDKFHGKGKLIRFDDVQEGFWFMGSFECHYGDEVKPCNYVEIKK